MAYLKIETADSLKCGRNIDSFSVSNNQAQLNYPIGLPNYYELYLLNNNILRSGTDFYWLMDGAMYDGNTVGIKIAAKNGVIDYSSSIDLFNNVRPSISLKSGVEYSSGDGSMANPYIISTN